MITIAKDPYLTYPAPTTRAAMGHNSWPVNLNFGMNKNMIPVGSALPKILHNGGTLSFLGFPLSLCPFTSILFWHDSFQVDVE